MVKKSPGGIKYFSGFMEIETNENKVEIIYLFEMKKEIWDL
jgi:hypothetical protein